MNGTATGHWTCPRTKYIKTPPRYHSYSAFDDADCKAAAERVETRPERKEAKMENRSSGKQLPEKKFKAGAVTATIWRNETAKGAYASVQLDRHYKDGEVWKSTGSLRLNDLPKATLVLNKAFEYLISKEGTIQSKEDSIAIEEIM